jgi:HSP20 family protein
MAQQIPVSAHNAEQLKADVYETPGGDAYVIEIPVPGIRPDEIVIEIDIDSVTVSTEPRQAEGDATRRYIHREQSLRSMSRIFEFPTPLDTDNVRATLEQGILKLRAPKAIAGRRKVIRVGQAA